MRELEELGPELEPPRGGLLQLRQRVSTSTRRRKRERLAFRWSAALALPVLALAILLPPRIQHWQRTHALSHALQQAAQPAPHTDAIKVTNGAALQLDSGQANVRLYLVQAGAAATKPAQ